MVIEIDNFNLFKNSKSFANIEFAQQFIIPINNCLVDANQW